MISAAVGGAGAEEVIAPLIEERFGLSENIAEGLSIAIVVLPLTYLSVVLGELVPKSIALRFSKQVALRGARWSAWAETFLSPFVWLLEVSTKIGLRLLFLKPENHSAGKAPVVEIDSLTRQAQQYVRNLSQVETQRVTHVMTAWSDVQCVGIEEPVELVKEKVLQSGHTRVPVASGQEVLGLLHTKELFSYLHAGEGKWTSLIRPVVVLQEADLALSALRQLQGQRSQLGVVFGADKRPLGILTAADVLERIVGEIYDEDDDGNVRRLLQRSGRLSSLVRK